MYEDKVINISNIADFINIACDADKIYFRGENMDYSDTRLVAAGLRESFDISSLCGQFYREVFSELSQNEEENFLAFSQHHGIPTNLLDITSNPLVALFFACDGNDESDGFVYCFEDTLYDATVLFVQQEKLHLSSLIDGLSGAKESEAITDFFNHCYKKDYHRWKKFCDESVARIKQEISKDEFNKWFRSQLKVVNDSDFGGIDNKQLSDDEFFLRHSDFCCKTPFYLQIVKMYSCHYNDEMREYYVLPPTIYKPLLSFKRAKSQKGCFIYQWYRNDTLYGFGNNRKRNMYQKIHPDLIISIPAKEKNVIKEVLDKFGINKASIFGDYDHIAEYVIKKDRLSISESHDKNEPKLDMKVKIYHDFSRDKRYKERN